MARVCVSARRRRGAPGIGRQRRREARFGVDILDGVGSTELLHIFPSNAPGDIKYGSSGRPVPGYKVRLVNEVRHRRPRWREVGEPPGRCAIRRGGLLNQRARPGKRLRGIDPHRRQITAMPTAATPCGRSDDMSGSPASGYRHSKSRAKADTYPAVLEAAVVPEADPEGLLKPYFVVLRAGCKTDGLHEALKEHVKQKIGPWKYPRWIDVAEVLAGRPRQGYPVARCGNINLLGGIRPGMTRNTRVTT